MLANLKTDDNIESEVDVLGGSGPLDSDIYSSKVDMIYLGKSKGGAMSVTLHLTTDTKQTIRQTLWVTSGDAKGNKNYYETKDGDRKYLPGFNLLNSLSLLSIGKEASELTSEKKIVNVYSYEHKKEVPTEVEVIVELLGQEIYAAVLKQLVDKRSNVAGEGQAADYQPTGETREENEIDKFFRAKDKMTTAEIRGGAEEPGFFNKWLEKNRGNIRDKSTKTSGTAGSPSAPKAAAPTKSLFG